MRWNGLVYFFTYLRGQEWSFRLVFFFHVVVIISWPIKCVLSPCGECYTTDVDNVPSVLSFTGVFGAHGISSLFRLQILMHGEMRSHHVTLYLKNTTLPSIWTTRWPETILWGLYIWRASMWPKQASGPLKTMDTLVNTLHVPSWTCVTSSLLCLSVGDHMLLFAFSRAGVWQWHVSERWRSSRCVPHHPAALPLGRPVQ